MYSKVWDNSQISINKFNCRHKKRKHPEPNQLPLVSNNIETRVWEELSSPLLLARGVCISCRPLKLKKSFQCQQLITAGHAYLCCLEEISSKAWFKWHIAAQRAGYALQCCNRSSSLPAFILVFVLQIQRIKFRRQEEGKSERSRIHSGLKKRKSQLSLGLEMTPKRSGCMSGQV